MKIETKSILAKLLATENISVEQKEMSTAAFDPNTRTLYIPKWKDMSNCLQDLLIGHEVGHAWDTPAEGWHEAVCSDATLKPFLNIIEDARIERNIKSRYPGLVKSFYAGYRELFERDFFGVKDVDVNALSLIDRINLHFKVGPFLNIQFSDEEKNVVSRCEKTKSWEDVEALARELHGMAKETANQDLQNIQEMFDNDQDVDMEDYSDSDTEFDDIDASDNEAPESDSPSNEDEDTEDADTELESAFSGQASATDEKEDDAETEDAVSKFIAQGGIGSITDDTFREKESELIADKSTTRKDSYSVNIPTSISLDFVTPAKDVHSFNNFVMSDHSSVEEHAEKIYKEYVLKNKSTLNQMTSAFEMKRKAALYVKAKTAKSGDLDENRLWSYKTSDNLFKQITSIPEGKNHGMVMYLDMSGSMSSIMAGTIEQLINLSMFCRKINIPFEVYGFTTIREYKNYTYDTAAIPGNVYLGDLNLTHLLSSSFTKNQTEMAYKCLLLWRDSFTLRWQKQSVYTKGKKFDLGATPLNATIVAAMEIGKRFRKNNNVEIMSTIFLTDGEATDSLVPYILSPDNAVYPRGAGWNPEITIKYQGASVPVYTSGFCHNNTKITATLLDMYKDITGSKAINYHLVSKWSLRSLEDCRNLYTIENTNMSFYDWGEIVKNRKSGVIEVKDTVGFDVRYLVKAADLKIEEEELEVKSNKKADLLRGFKKFAGNKTQSRVFVQKFIPQVS